MKVRKAKFFNINVLIINSLIDSKIGAKIGAKIFGCFVKSSYITQKLYINILFKERK